MITTIVKPTITLHLCPEGAQLYEQLAGALAMTHKHAATRTKFEYYADNYPLMRSYFYHRNGDGHKIQPCLLCRVEAAR